MNMMPAMSFNYGQPQYGPQRSPQVQLSQSASYFRPSPANLPPSMQQQQLMQTPSNMQPTRADNPSNWDKLDFVAIFRDAQQIQSTITPGEVESLPFPPPHLLAQYPPDYQRQLIVYYVYLRRLYPQLYEQYVQYYEMYYKPLYFPAAPTPATTPPSQQQPQQPQPAPQPMTPPQPQTPIRDTAPIENTTQAFVDMSSYAMSRVPNESYTAPEARPAMAALSRPSSSSSIGGLQRQPSTLTRQSSIRRQNSMRRSELNAARNRNR